MAMDIATLGLAVDASQVKKASLALDDFSESATDAEHAANKMQREIDSALGPMRQMAQIAAAIGLAMGVREMINYADTWKLIEGRLKLVTDSYQELKATQQALFDVSQDTRTSFESTADLYIRVARNADQLGLSQQETMRFTELTSKAIQVGGASAQEAAGGITQLSQALATGRLMGDEFRSVIENLQGVAKFAGEGFRQMGMTTQTGTAALFELRDAGRLTASDFIAAIQMMSDEIDKEFESIPRTVGQALTQLENAMMRQVGLADEYSGATEIIARAIGDLADNLEDLTPYVIAFSVALTARAIPAIVAATQAIRAMTIAAAANPYGLIAIGIGYAAGLLYEFRDATLEVGDTSIRVGNVVSAIWVTIAESIKGTLSYLWGVYKALGEIMTLDFKGAGEAIQKGFADMGESGQKIVDSWTSLDEVPKSMEDLSKLLEEVTKEAVNASGGIRSFDESIAGLKAQLDALDSGGIEAMKQVQDRIKAEQELAKAGGRGNVDEITAQITEERRLNDTLKRRVQAIQEAVDKQKELSTSVAELNNQTDTYKLLTDQIRQVGEATDEYRDKLEVQLEARRQEIDITQGAGQAWYEAALAEREAARELDSLTEKMETGKSLTEAMRTPLEEYRAALEEINQLLAANAISEDTAATARKKAAAEYEEAERRKLDASREWADGVQRALQDYAESATDAAAQAEQAVSNGMRSMENAFTGVITGTKSVKEAFSDMVTSILEDLARMMVKQYITGPIASALGGFFGGMGGGGDAGAITTPTATVHTGGVIGQDGGAHSPMPIQAWSGAQKLHDGGFAANEVPIIALRGERMLTEAQQDNTARSLEALSRMAMARNDAPAAMGGRGDVNVNVINNADGTQTRTEERQNQSGGRDIDIIIEQVEDKMGRRISRGEGLAPTLEGKYGLNPAAGAVR